MGLVGEGFSLLDWKEKDSPWKETERLPVVVASDLGELRELEREWWRTELGEGMGEEEEEEEGEGMVESLEVFEVEMVPLWLSKGKRGTVTMDAKWRRRWSLRDESQGDPQPCPEERCIGFTQKRVVLEFHIIEIAENVCSLKKEEADSIPWIDIVEKGDKLKGMPGHQT
ncbi:hypothetical protein J5N97_013429 [Dioscorea zingiberensis]|uniref:Uncharacterized protein n=1 Tax=Dioscorea zingiberensis TaxID=325984 RepID=A0A9D5HIM5_9LILI|nr:hypothetical protein J5N97_013429 [Dioscorea zingiberensis]